MKRIMTAAEIEKSFVSEWVLVLDPQMDDSMEVRAGTVVFHSKDRDEVYRKAIELRPKRFAMLFTGKLPKGTSTALRDGASLRPLGVNCCRAAHPQSPRLPVLLLQFGEPRAGAHPRGARRALREVLAGSRRSRRRSWVSGA
ncbi:MAG: hypothetical protein ACHQ1G_06530 [Planctomycetota bacterium]